MIVENYWVDIEDGSSVKLGAGPLRVISFRVSRPLSQSGDFNFEVLVASPNISVLAEKRVAMCRYLDSSGALQVFGGGVIDQITLQTNQDGLQVYQVSGNDLTRELNYRSVGSLALTDGVGGGVTDAPDQIMALAPSGWTVTGGGTTATAVYAGFDGESVLSALCRAGEAIGEHWRLGSGRNITWLGAMSGFSASGIRAVQHVNDPVGFESQTGVALILSLEEAQDAADLLTRVIPRGSGNGGAILTLAAATDAAPSGYTLSTASNYLKHNAAETTYGRIERVLDFKNIGPLSNTRADIQGAANALLEAAYQHLQRYSAPLRAYKIGLWANQMLLPGTTVRVVYRSLIDGVVVYDLNTDLIILSAEHTLDSTGLHTNQVEVGNIDRLPMSDADVILGQARNGTVVAAHQQLNASVDTLTWRDEMDDGHAANFRFWLGSEYTSINQAVLRFRIQPLRSTVKSVAGSSTTTASGGGSTATSAGGDHSHILFLDDGSTGNPVMYDASVGLQVSGGGIDYTEIDAPAHTHNVDIPAHTHTLTPLLTTVYGIFEEAGGNTLAESDLVYKLNAGSDLGAGVTSIGSGWYELDITSSLVDSVNRPSQANNLIEISTATAKTARIEAQLTVRGVIQAISYT